MSEELLVERDHSTADEIAGFDVCIGSRGLVLTVEGIGGSEFVDAMFQDTDAVQESGACLHRVAVLVS